MSGAMVRTVIVGASGRMGQHLIRLLPQYAPLQLVGAIVSVGSQALGRDAFGIAGLKPPAGRTAVPCSADLAAVLQQGADLVIDFSSHVGAAASVAACRAARVPLLMCTTGWGAEVQQALAAASAEIPVLVAANTSLGVNVLVELVRQAAAMLPAGFDIEIVEAHHGGKRDAPSGTALALGRAAAEGRNLALDAVAVAGRQGLSGPRTPGEIGFASVRGGDVVGEHEVHFLGSQERLRFCHSATDRAVFARGALAAGRWLAGQKPGAYRMADMLKVSC
ncbi:MAG: 4-hydroxy-tetrahydrodipicolinate reductase [Steroidobacteraceae bacterium]